MELLMTRLPDSETAPETLEIETLVRKTLAGDCRAFEQIVLQYERRVMTLSSRLLHGIDEAQDATQEVFLRAFKYLHRLDVRRPVEPWLMRITVNVCRDIQRKTQRRHYTFCEVPLPETETPGSGPDPYSGFAWEQERQRLWTALNALPEKERMALILRDVEGFSTAEVAEILGSSETTVRSQICRGRLRLREAMDRKTGDQS